VQEQAARTCTSFPVLLLPTWQKGSWLLVLLILICSRRTALTSDMNRTTNPATSTVPAELATPSPQNHGRGADQPYSASHCHHGSISLVFCSKVTPHFTCREIVFRHHTSKPGSCTSSLPKPPNQFWHFQLAQKTAQPTIIIQGSSPCTSGTHRRTPATSDLTPAIPRRGGRLLPAKDAAQQQPMQSQNPSLYLRRIWPQNHCVS
jgi:hypothetical protein